MFGPTSSPGDPAYSHGQGRNVPAGPPPVGQFAITIYPLSEGYVVQTPYHAVACGTRQQLNRAIARVLTHYEGLVAGYAAVTVPAQTVPATAQAYLEAHGADDPGPETPPDLLEALDPEGQLEAQRHNVARIQYGRLRGTIEPGEVQRLLEQLAPSLSADEISEILAREEVLFFEKGGVEPDPIDERPVSIEEWANAERTATTTGNSGDGRSDAQGAG